MAIGEMAELSVPADTSTERMDVADLIPGIPASRMAAAGDERDFIERVTATLIAGRGDLLPVSAFPIDGTSPTGTTRYEKRRLAAEIPVWEPTSASTAASARSSAPTPRSA